MMAAENDRSRAGSTRNASVSEYPDCPRCHRPMTVRQVTPAMLQPDLDEIVFCCEDCGTEVKLTAKRRGGAPSSSHST